MAKIEDRQKVVKQKGLVRWPSGKREREDGWSRKSSGKGEREDGGRRRKASGKGIETRRLAWRGLEEYHRACARQ